MGGGWLADRFRIKRVLIGMYLLAAASISLLGQPTAVMRERHGAVVEEMREVGV